MNSFLYPNGVKSYPFEAKDPEIKPYPLCLGKISTDFTVNNMKKHGLRGMHTISLPAMLPLMLVNWRSSQAFYSAGAAVIF